MLSPTRSIGRTALPVLLLVALVAGGALIVPGPARLVAALLALPPGAYLFANVGALARPRWGRPRGDGAVGGVGGPGSRRRASQCSRFATEE